MAADPDDAEIAALVDAAKRHSSAVVGTFNAYLRTGQRRLVEALAKAGVPTVAVALRAPYDLAGLPESVWTLAAYEYTPESLRAAARVLRGETPATGRLSVKL